MHSSLRTMCAVVVFTLASACGSGATSSADFNVSWSFLTGDCASNNITQVKVTWSKQGGMPNVSTYACGDGQAKVGQFDSAGTYVVTAEGLDQGGVARVYHLGTTLNLQQAGNGGHPIALTLRPKPGTVNVTWHFAGGGGCPGSTILPFFLTALQSGVDAGTSGNNSTQESCSTKAAVLGQLQPGDYVIDLDSRAVSPMVKAQKNVTVTAGDTAAVDFAL